MSSGLDAHGRVLSTQHLQVWEFLEHSLVEAQAAGQLFTPTGSPTRLTEFVYFPHPAGLSRWARARLHPWSMSCRFRFESTRRRTAQPALTPSPTASR